MPTYAQEACDCSRKALRSQMPEGTIFSRLGRSLNEAATVRRVAEIVLDAADELLGWDAASLDLYSPELDTSDCILAMDLIEGRRAEVTPAQPGSVPSPKMRQVIGNGTQFILRGGAPGFATDSTPFGDTSRPSASLLLAPIRCQNRVLGVLTMQSYTPQAYAPEDLDVLQALADHCGGAIQRIQAEGSLRRTEELYRRAIGGAGAVPYAYDYRTKSYSFMGEGIEQLTGYPAHEISSGLWLRIVQESAMTGEAAGLDKREAARRVETGELHHWRCDMRILTREGKSRWLSDASVQHLDEAGRVIGSMGILEDITERKQAELSALAMSKLGQSLISATTLDEAARLLVQVANELFGWDACAFYLYSPETDLVHPVLYMDTIDGQRVEVAPPTLDGKPSPCNRRIIENGADLTLKEGTAPAMDPTGTPFGNTSRPSAAIMRVPLRLRTKKVSGIVAIHSYTPQAYSQKDLKTLQTMADCCGVALERIWADEALLQSESQFRLVWESSGDGMRLTDRDGIMLRVNDAYCRMVQKSRKELEGQLMTIVHSKANADFVLSTYQKRVDSNALVPHFGTEVILWNGAKAWFELSNSLLEVPGKLRCVLSIFRDVTIRKQTELELASMHQQLLEVSRQAGMAEVATNVLHNVGNVLNSVNNSVNVSSSLVSDMVRTSKAGNLAKAVALLQAHENDLGDFLTNDPKGRQLPGYLKSLANHLAGEQQETLKELKSLAANIDHIKEIITMQQSYAKVLGVTESLPVVDLVEDAMRLNAGAMERHQVKVVREYFEVPPILVDKHKVLQILVNLIRNAKYALDDRGHTDKRMVLQVGLNGNNTVKISVIDNGVGIPSENLTRIFEHGFTTRKEGHGFGLHNGALTAKELGGKLTAYSDGPGKGATFTLELPRQPREKGHSTELRSKLG
jgi:PAS domain S-box-containing protein